MGNIDRITDLVGNSQFEEAKSLIEEDLKNSPEDVELLKIAGLVYVNLDMWEQAKNAFETAVKYDQNNATSWFYLAKCYENTGNLLEAEKSYLHVIELRPEYSDAYKNLCLIYLKLKKDDELIKYAQLAQEYDKEDYIFDFLIGTAHMTSKNFNLALESLLSAFEKSPNKPEIINSLGTCYIATGETDKAIEYYQKAMELHPNSPMSYFNIGSAYQLQQKHEKAIEYFKIALGLEEDERFLNALAMSEIKIEDYSNALNHYKQLATLCPNKETYRFNIVICYEALQEYDIAIKMLEEMVFINPKFFLPAQKLANLYIKTNQPVKAKDIFDKIILKNKVTADILHQYAVLSSSLNDTETAEKMLKKVIRMEPESAKAHKDLAIIFLNKRLFDYAEEEFQIALKLAPNDFEMLFEYGNYLYSVSKNSEAERYYAEALEIEPENILALVFMALNKLVLNQIDEAVDYIMQALKYEPEHEYVQFCAGRILYAKGDYEEAKRYLVKAVEQNPDIETMNTLALTYFKLEDFSQALNIFSAIEKKSPNSISVLMDIARCYEKLGEKDNALAYLDKVVDIFPENEDAHEMIRKLS